MKLEDILTEWRQDSEVNKTELGEESLKISKLHSKYYSILSSERLLLKKFDADLKILKLQKYEFFLDGPNEETQARGWRLPAKGRVTLKSDIPMHMDADDDIIQLNLKIALQLEKLELLESIVKILMGRSYTIRNAIDWQRFMHGG